MSMLVPSTYLAGDRSAAVTLCSVSMDKDPHSLARQQAPLQLHCSLPKPHLAHEKQMLCSFSHSLLSLLLCPCYQSLRNCMETPTAFQVLFLTSSSAGVQPAGTRWWAAAVGCGGGSDLAPLHFLHFSWARASLRQEQQKGRANPSPRKSPLEKEQLSSKNKLTSAHMAYQPYRPVKVLGFLPQGFLKQEDSTSWYFCATVGLVGSEGSSSGWVKKKSGDPEAGGKATDGGDGRKSRRGQKAPG